MAIQIKLKNLNFNTDTDLILLLAWNPIIKKIKSSQRHIATTRTKDIICSFCVDRTKMIIVMASGPAWSYGNTIHPVTINAKF